MSDKETQILRQTVDKASAMYNGYENFYQACMKKGIRVPTRQQVMNALHPLNISGVGSIGSGFNIFEPGMPMPSYVPPRGMNEQVERERQQQVRQFNQEIQEALQLVNTVRDVGMVPQQRLNEQALRLINQFIIDNFGTYENFYKVATRAGYTDIPRQTPTEITNDLDQAINYYTRNMNQIPPIIQARPIDPRFRYHGFEEWSSRGRQEVEERNQSRAQREQEARERIASDVRRESLIREIEMQPLEQIEEKYPNPPIAEMEEKYPIDVGNEQKQIEVRTEPNEFMRSFLREANRQNVIIRLITALLAPPENQSISKKRQVIARVPVRRVADSNWDAIKPILKKLERQGRRLSVITPILNIMEDMGFPPVGISESMVDYYNRVIGNMTTPNIQEFVNRVLDSLRITLPEVGRRFINFEQGALSGESVEVMPTFDLQNNALRHPIITELERLGLSQSQAMEIYDKLSKRLLDERINSFGGGEKSYEQAQEQSRANFTRDLDSILRDIDERTRIKINRKKLFDIFSKMREGLNTPINLQNIPDIARRVINTPLPQILERRIIPNQQPINDDPNLDQTYEALNEMFGSQRYNIVNLPQIIIFQEPPPRGLEPIPEGDDEPDDPPEPVYNIGIGAVNNRRFIRGLNPRTLGLILSILVALGVALKTVYMIIEAIKEEHTDDVDVGNGTFPNRNDTKSNQDDKPTEPTPSFPNTPNRPDWLAPRDTIDYKTGTVIAGAPRNREDIKNILKEFNPSNINKIKPMSSLAPITAQILPNNGGSVMPKQATPIEYQKYSGGSLKPMGTYKGDDVFINTIRPVENKPLDDRNNMWNNPKPNDTKDTWDTGTYPTGSIPITDITLKPSNAIDDMSAGIRDIDKFDYDKIAELQLYIYETQQKVKSGKYSKEENDYMNSEISKATSMIKTIVPNQGIYNKARDTMYDQDLIERTKNYYDNSIQFEQNFNEAMKQYEVELARLKMMFKDPMLTRNDVSMQKNYVDELKASVEQNKNEYDNNIKLIAYGGDLKSNLSIPNEYFPKTVDDAVKFNQIQQLERGLMKDFAVNPDGSYKPKTAVPDAAKPAISAYDQYQKIVRNMPYSNKYYDARLSELQKQYQKNSIVLPDIKTISIAPLTELITDDSDAIVEFNKDVDIRNDEGSATLRATVKNPAEVDLFIEDNKTARIQQARWESFSRVPPGHGLGSMKFNTLRQHNARADAKRFSHSLQDAPRYNPTIASQTGKPMPSMRELEELQALRNHKFSVADQPRFIPELQNDFGIVNWEEDGYRANHLMSNHFTHDCMSSNNWSEDNNAKSIYHPELALYNSLYRKDVIRPVEIKETRHQGYYMGLPDNIRPSQQSNVLISNDKTDINYTPLMRNDCFNSMGKTQLDNIDRLRQPIKGLIKPSKVFSEFA
jgi:hypothetical protein